MALGFANLPLKGSSKYSEYLCITDHDDIGIDRFLSPLTTHICSTFAVIIIIIIIFNQIPYILGTENIGGLEKYQGNCWVKYGKYTQNYSLSLPSGLLPPTPAWKSKNSPYIQNRAEQ